MVRKPCADTNLAGEGLACTCRDNITDNHFIDIICINATAFNRGLYTFNAATRVFTPTTNFGANTGTADPRILQLAARIQF